MRMRGTVLGFKDDKGVIITADDNRFSFTIENWREAQPPLRGTAVDFVARDGTADDIYFSLAAARPARTGAQPAHQPGQPAPAPGQGAGPYLASRPGLVFAGVILLGCLLPFLSLGVISPNLFTIVSGATTLADFARGSGGIQSALLIFYLLYAIPIMAGWLIFQEARGEATPGLRTWTGIVALATPFAVIILSSLIAQTSRPGGFGSGWGGRYRGGGDLGLSVIGHMHLGWFLIIAASIALIAVGRGWSPFGKSEGGG
jgi:hypothetical protein